MLKPIGVVLISAILTGCGTFGSRVTHGYECKVYPATQFDIQGIKEGYPFSSLIDLPFSIITDTLILPWDTHRLYTDEICKKTHL
ncbi:YceK/YidQ family lipoprotein [Photorhabdus luminescens]|uniref:YceK/YidQ family lipoprotein n=1 Tax=Photorhabdus akhurstii TaxID=171438 RepID=A0ABX8M0Y0_9GAMM|nr:YceK/YidQ family lipoprotein [Photorhabdus akhurstii]MBS9427600.1 YceK/YidQ family lipoprotein [Photorhabdus akhurstii]QXF34802.1 hypothetical protein B0X70_17750 [Photorhabdus akhurstii]UJD76629.1 YceK/YidQ family lipoprotein [Photorhabdus luminescens]